MLSFKRYKNEKNEDGSYNILNVPIFKLGKHRGFNYDESWFEKTKTNHTQDEQNDYFPSVIIGHNDDKGEKPARGFLKNLQLSGENILADLIKIPENVFEQIKDRAFPHRSIEVKPKSNKITALALLGGTEPYHKLPVLEVFSEAEDAEVLSFMLNDNSELEWDTSILDEAQKDESLSKLRRVISVFTDRLWQIFNSNKDIKTIKAKTTQVLDEGSESIKTELNKIKTEVTMKTEKEPELFTQDQVDAAKVAALQEGSVKYREDFKAKHGVYPEDYVSRMSQAEETARVEKITAFCQDLKSKDFEGKAIAPALIDDVITPFLNMKDGTTVKFDDKDYDREGASQVVIEKLINAAAENKLFADLQEHSEHGNPDTISTHFDADESCAPEDLALHKKALMYQQEHDCSYEDAVRKVIGG